MIRTDLVAPVGELIMRQARRRPDAPSFRDAARAVTYGELGHRTAQVAVHLTGLGIVPDERVGVYLPNSVDWVECCLGIVRAGAVAVPISFEATPDEISYRLEDAQCTAVFTRPERATALAEICSANGLAVRVITIANGQCAAFESALIEAPRDPADITCPSFIVYTSGTTGKAKGVLLSQQGMLWVTAACWAPIAGLNENDYVLNALPLYHSYALNLAVLSIVATGASEYLMEHFSTSHLFDLLQEQRFTLLPGVPTVFHYLLERGRQDKLDGLGAMRLCISAGAILPGTLNQEFEAWSGIKLLDGYGITETSTMVTLNWPEGTRVPGSCGLPLPGLQVRIVDAAGADVVVDHEGELIVRGPNIMLGYHDKPDATREAVVDGWYHTGDLARHDRFGFISITGRLKEVIIRGGQNIAPAEVEECVLAYCDVLDVAVAGVAHPHLGEVPVAFVIPREGSNLDCEALIQYCQQRLSAYKIPAQIHIVEAIPRTGSGKVQRFKLKAMVEPG